MWKKSEWSFLTEKQTKIIDKLAYKKVEEFQYLGILMSTKNDSLREFDVKIAKAEKASFM
jgi:hypothetical protein